MAEPQHRVTSSHGGRRLRTADLHYELPAESIAIHPAHPRDAARLMVIDRAAILGAESPGDLISHAPRYTRQLMRHAQVRDLPSFLRAGDLLVLNQTRVLPARFLGVREDTGGQVEGLYLGPGARHSGNERAEPAVGVWHVLLKMKHQRAGLRVRLTDRRGGPSVYSLVLVERAPSERTVEAAMLGDRRTDGEGVLAREGGGGGGGGGWIVRVEHVESAALAGTRSSDIDVLEHVGWPPLPPYILAARKQQGETREQAQDFDEYQTVFAEKGGASPSDSHPSTKDHREHDCEDIGGAIRESGKTRPPPAPARWEGVLAAPGSIAAPTAGLHFTPELLTALEAKGVHCAYVNLHVGLGTFKPVETEFVEDHPMHAEWCSVPRATADAIARVREQQAKLREAMGADAPVLSREEGEAEATACPRIVAVGTTSARTLESFESINDLLTNGEAGRWTRLLITPGRRFRHVDALMTNFHLPGSTLMAMVGAFLEQPQWAHEREASVTDEYAGAESSPRADGVSVLKHAYGEAIARGYRFYSFGDAMFIQ